MGFPVPRPLCLRCAMPRHAPPGRGVPPEHSAAARGVRGSRIWRPVRSLRRHARAVACVVLGLAAVASTTPAAAQPASAYEHVSNFLSTPDFPLATVADHSQRFTTGSNSGGYKLYDVLIRTTATRGPGGHLIGDVRCTGDEDFLSECPFVGNPFLVSVCRVLASGYPDRDSCTLLNPPSSFEPGNLTFTAPEVADPNGIDVEKIELAPNTTYTLLTEVAVRRVEGEETPLTVEYGVTDSDDETTESSPGWSIWNDYDSYNGRDDSWGPHYAQAHRVRIRATRGHSTAVITSVDVTSSSSHPPLHGPSDIIEFTVTLSEDVTVGGDPVFLFSLGGADTEASYDAERSTARILVFKYTVQAGDKVTDGIRVGNGPRTFRLDDNDHIRTLRSLQDALLDHDALGTRLDAPVATVQTLVSNFGQPPGTGRPTVVFNTFKSQAFTTGSNSAGYGLDSIRVNVSYIEPRPNGHTTASIWTTNADGNPLTKLFDMSNPRSNQVITLDPLTFTAANTTLNTSTRYAFVITSTGRAVGFEPATTTAEDPGSASGWLIADFLRTRTAGGGNTNWRSIPSFPLRIEFKGTILDPTDATLRSLALSDASDDSNIALSPAFASSITSYTASVANRVDEITIAPATNNNGASVEYLDGSDTAISDADTTKNGQQVSLAVAANTIKVQVTAEDGTTPQPYTVTVTRTSTDATLSALALSDASDDSNIALRPAFASGITSYTALVANRVDEITIAPATNNNAARVAYLDGNDTLISDADTMKNGQQVSLAVGANTIKVQVTAEDGTTLRTYTVTVTRAEPEQILSADATLRSLTLSDASDDSDIPLRPAFASDTTSYTALVANRVDKITIAPATNNNGASVEYLNSSDAEISDADTTKNGQQVSLAVGANTIKVKVTAEDGTTPQPYTVTVTRAEPEQILSADATLRSLALSDASDDSDIPLSPPFASGHTSYTASVLNGVDKITIAPTTTNNAASVAYLDGSNTAILDADTTKNGRQVSLAVGPNTIKVQVTAADGTTPQPYTVTVNRAEPPLTGVGTGTTTGTTTGGGGGGGGGGPSQDEHGNTPGQATLVTLDPTRTASVPGQINPAPDVDYFSVDVPHAGVLVVETSGPTATMGTVWQAGAELATADSGGVGQNFRLSVRVAPGPVVIAVAGNGQQTGAYTLQVTFLPGYLENPGAASFQSGIGVISGWTCDAEEVEIVLNGEPQEAAYGTARLDTAGVCGDADNGFGLLFNWNLLGDGEHEVVALVDGVELHRATVTVTTLGAEFLRDVTGMCTAADFPTGDETVTLAWQQTQQNFVLVDGPAPAGANRTGRAGVGYLENPGPNSFQSGIGVLSGWVCEGAEVIIELNGAPQPAAYGTERLDTEPVCGDTDNGFGLLFNWNLLGDGAHTVVALVDGMELGRATVQVTTLGAEFLRDVEGECVVEDFPMLGETVTLEWQQNSQNFVITDVE